jgi:hypothetical protein
MSVSTRESARERAKSDARSAVASVRFIVASALVGTAAGVVGVILPSHTAFGARLAVGALSGGAAVVVLGVIVLLALWVTAPIRQRDEARAEVVRLSKSEFPAHRLSLKPPRYLDAPKWDVRLLFLPISYTNRGNRGVSLEIDLLWRRVVEGGTLGPYRVSRSRHARDLEDAIDLPLDITPHRTEEGDLLLEPYESWVFEFGEFEVWVKDDYELSLHLTDYVSGATMERPIPRREWTAMPSAGQHGRPQDDSQASRGSSGPSGGEPDRSPEPGGEEGSTHA